MSVRPARIGHVPTRVTTWSSARVANIAVVDPDASRTITPTALASKSRNTPYAGMELPGRVVHTLFAGTPTVLDGALA